MGPRRLPQMQKKVVEKELQAMLEKDIIEPGTGPWAAPIVLVTKKDGSVRFCIDYRKLNQVTRKDAYPLPRIDTSLESLGGSKWFSTLDLASGYWQSEMEDAAKPKTGFVTHTGLFQFKVLPFGLCNAPATFERLMDLVLRGLHWKHCLCYLDDVIVFGSTFAEALQNLQLVFDRLRTANLKLKPSKCNLFQTELSFLGHVVSEEGIKCDPDKVDTILSWPIPKNVSEVRSFLGIIGYYRRFIPACSTLCSPLNDLLKKSARFTWSDQCQLSFETLKLKLTSNPVLAYPNETDTFILDTDASLSGIGCVLSQVQNGEEKVISYSSVTLNKAQTRYCVTFRELLAVVTFVKKYRHFLWGREFLVRTDHASLVWLKNFKEPEGMLARWISVLETYDFEIQYRKGSLHSNADFMSRKPPRLCKRTNCPDCEKTRSRTVQPNRHRPIGSIRPVDEEPDAGTVTGGAQQSQTVGHGAEKAHRDLSEIPEILPNWLDCWSTTQIKQWQAEDETLSTIVQFKRSFESKPPNSELRKHPTPVRALWSLWESLHVTEDDVLYFRSVSHPNNDTRHVLVAPSKLKTVIFERLHCSRVAGHLGRDKTISSIKRRFFWAGMSSDIRRWCKECSQCAQSKPGPGLGKAPLSQFKVGSPLDVLAIDIVGPLPMTENGNEYIIVAGDYFSKWKEAFAVPDHTALTVADKIVTEIVCRMGAPTQIHTDQGREFQSHLFGHMCKLLGIDKTHTTPYRPQSDGLVERFNKTLKTMLKAYVNENRSNWDEQIPFVLMAYRSTIHDSTGCTPNSLMLGREVALPIDLMVGNPNSGGTGEFSCPVQYVNWLEHRMHKSFKFVAENLDRSAKHQKKYYDRGLKPRTFESGCFVWRWYPPKANLSLGLGWTGPYKILTKLTDLSYEIVRGPQNKPLVVHVDHLKPYESEHTPALWQANTPGEAEVNADSLETSADVSISESDTDLNVTPDMVESHSNEADITQRSRFGRPIRRPCPYSPTL
ncbi:MAG: reverse transcriptase domain-containing protein [Sedimenticola sp.]